MSSMINHLKISTSSAILLSSLCTVISMVAVPTMAQTPICQDIFTTKKSMELASGVVLPNRKAMAEVAKSIIQTIENNYGPLLLKKTTIGFDWNKQKQKLLGEMGKVTDEADLLFKISNFLYQFNDAHISIQLPSSLKWTLPMQISYEPNSHKQILNAINRKALQKNLVEGELPPLGAELVSINGTTIDQFRKMYPAFNAAGNDLTNLSLFGTKLFRLQESSGIPLSFMKNEGWSFEFQWKNTQGQLIRKAAKLKYDSDGIGILNSRSEAPATSTSYSLADLIKRNVPGSKPAAKVSVQLTGTENLIRKMSELIRPELAKEDRYSHLDVKDGLEGQAYKIGQTEPLFKLPKDFRKIELPDELKLIFDDSQIFVGTFIQNGKRVGLLRIPSYGLNMQETAPMAPLVIDYLVHRLQASTDYLILDQMHNPGGMVFYSDFWVKAFVGEFDSSKHLQFRVKPTAHFIDQFAELLVNFDRESIMLPEEFRRPLLNEIRQQYEIVLKAYKERAPLSEPISLLPMTKSIEFMLTMQKIAASGGQMELFNQPEKSVYTKPVYMLIDQFDFSGGDATPASLKGYGRVKLIGQRTAGAGGTVEEFLSRESSLEFTYRLTTSLMYQPAFPEAPYVENYGITPNIQFAPTAADLADGFQSFLPRLMEVINTDLSKKPSQPIFNQEKNK